MTNFLLYLLLGFVIGVQLGVAYRVLRDNLVAVRKRLAPPPPKQHEVVGGAYQPKRSTTTSASVIEPKSPSLLDWENREKLKEKMYDEQP